MELTHKTKENLRGLFNQYVDTTAGKDYIREVVWILDEDPELGFPLNYKFEENRMNPIYSSTYDDKIHVSPKFVPAYLKSLYKEYIKTYPEASGTLLYNYLIMFMILHETAHIEQFRMAEFKGYTHEELARAYSVLFSDAENNPKDRIKLYRKPLKNFSERNANLEACRIANDVFVGSLFESISRDDYIDYLLMGYLSTCPIEETFSLLGLPYSFDSRGMSAGYSLLNGFRVSVENLKEIKRYLNINQNATVEEIDQKILGLR